MSDREMTVAGPSRQLPFCDVCRMQKQTIDGQLECPNCFSANQPKTGQTIVVEEGNGPTKIRFVKDGQILAAPATPPASAPVVVAPSAAAGTIQINVPVELFAELVVWSRKLKLPRNWADAAKMKAIVDFQVHLMSKLTEIGQ